MAFPFTWLAVGVAIYLNSGQPWLFEWVWQDLIYRLVAGVAVGFLIGKAIAYFLFKLPDNENRNPREGFVAISSTLFIYGVTELISGYGFLAVFVAAVVIRNYEMDHEYHKELHRFTDQTEKILLVILLILFGGSISIGLLDSLTWTMAVTAIAFVLLLRPLAGILGLLGSKLEKKENCCDKLLWNKGYWLFLLFILWFSTCRL